jgi:hypothetical protein
MNKDVARRVRELRLGPVIHSWRRIAELICKEFPQHAKPEMSGNQLFGKDLCRQAAQLAGESEQIWEDEIALRLEWKELGRKRG